MLANTAVIKLNNNGRSFRVRTITTEKHALTSAVGILQVERGQRDAERNGWVLHIIDSRGRVSCGEVCLIADLDLCRWRSGQPDRKWIDAFCRAVALRYDRFRRATSVDLRVTAGQTWRHLHYKVNNDWMWPMWTNAVFCLVWLISMSVWLNLKAEHANLKNKAVKYTQYPQQLCRFYVDVIYVLNKL